MRAKQPEISADNFFNHVEKFYKTWTNSFGKQFDSVLVISGKAEQTNSHIEAALGWFFGFSLTPTVVLFTKKSIFIYTSENKIKVLAPIAENSKAAARGVVLLKREKQPEANIASYNRLVQALEESTKTPKIGVIQRGKDAVLDDFEQFIKDKSYKQQDCLPLLNECFMVKDSVELDYIHKSSVITTYFFHKLVDNILQIIDNEQQVPHSEISGKMESMLESENELRKAEANLSAHGIKKELIDNICNGPAIQSGGHYVMKLLPEPDKETLKVGCVVVGFGCKYQMYNSFVTRTLLIGKSEHYEVTYGKVLQLHKLLISSIEPGKKIKQVYKKAVEYIKVELPESEVPSNFGSGVGLEFRENLIIINDTNERNFEPGMTLLVTCGFKGLKIANSTNTFAVQLSDVVQVNEKGPCTVLTENENTKKSFRKVFWEFGDGDDKKKESKKDNKRESSGRKQDEMIPEGRGARKRNMKKFPNHTNLKERNEHQMELKQKKLEELKLRLNDNFSGSLKKIKQVDYEKVECYKNREEFPKDIKKNKIYVDAKNNALLLPINGVMVPFHVNVLKNIVKYEEGKFAALRFNFHTPLAGLIGNINLPELAENTIFVKQLTYRSQNIRSLTDVFKNIKELQRKIKNMADEQKNKEEIVDQEKLQINKSKKPLLRQLGIRPNLMNKKAKGSLQCHFNGFRYTAQKGEIIDVIFTNIKNAFIQPPEESIAAIHFRLHHPIMIGKKKTEDVQFYAQVGGIAEDVERYRRGDDDSDDEELVRAARRKLEKELMDFGKACQEYSKDAFHWEVPIRDLGFTGTPYKATSLLVPTNRCLINLTEQPFFVLNMDQVEIAWFERMFANLTTFDLTFVYKDFEKFIRVQAIPINEVEKIKDWLDKSGIIFCDIQRIFDWSKFLLPIRSDFKSFVDDGAWLAWQSESEEEEGDSVFTPEPSEVEEAVESSESSDDSGYDQEEDNDSGSYDAEEDLSEEGLSESEMERRFEEEDNRKIKKELEKEKERHARKKK